MGRLTTGSKGTEGKTNCPLLVSHLLFPESGALFPLSREFSAHSFYSFSYSCSVLPRKISSSEPYSFERVLRRIKKRDTWFFRFRFEAAG